MDNDQTKKWIDFDINYRGVSYERILWECIDVEDTSTIRYLLDHYPLSPELQQEATNYLMMKEFGHSYKMKHKPLR